MPSRLPPKLPEEWLRQIQQASKAEAKKLFWITIIGTILGSSVIASLIGVAASFGVENYKARIEIRKERVQETQKPFKTLADSLRRLHNELGNAAANLAVANPEGQEITGYAQQSLSQVETLMQDVFEENKDQRINENIREKVRAMENSLDPVLKAAKSDPKNYSALVTLYKTSLDKEINDIIAMIDNAVNSMTVQIQPSRSLSTSQRYIRMWRLS